MYLRRTVYSCTKRILAVAVRKVKLSRGGGLGLRRLHRRGTDKFPVLPCVLLNLGVVDSASSPLDESKARVVYILSLIHL